MLIRKNMSRDDGAQIKTASKRMVIIIKLLEI